MTPPIFFSEIFFKDFSYLLNEILIQHNIVIQKENDVARTISNSYISLIGKCRFGVKVLESWILGKVFLDF